MKKYSKLVYACPFCWVALELGKKPKVPAYCSKDKTWIKPGEMIVFDSIEEHRVGFEQKTLEGAGVIQDLKHHEKFELIPKIWFSNPLEGAYYRIVTEKDMNVITEIPHQYSFYESDFSFYQGEEKRVIEIKDLGRKMITKFKHEGSSVKSFVPWPFFTRTNPLLQFKKKCQLMKVIHKIDVEIWAGGKGFMFDEKWKLVEVTK